MALAVRFPRSRPLRIALALALLVALACIGWWIGSRAIPVDVTARPALWRISQGHREAYLFGTIHAVPKSEVWLSPAIAKAAARSDVLILEVTDLERERRSRAIFERLGRSDGLLPIARRLDRVDAARFKAEAQQYGAELHGVDDYESWAAALLINAAATSGLSLSANNAGEATLGRLFAGEGKPTEGLETIEGQLGLFDTLPEADQRILLAQAVQEAGDAPRLYRYLYGAWSRGDLVALERQFLAPLDKTPTLRRVLIDQRNRNWSLALDRRLRTRTERPFLAVGAGHLLGETGLPARLSKLGWRVERLQ